MTEKIMLVNGQDQPLGEEEKLIAHQKGLLHRAFSIFIYREHQNDKEFLLQKRYRGKYHSPGLWTNTCCGHPHFHETTLEAARRRLKEEMGFETDLKEIGKFHYHAFLDHDLIENEIDHVFIGPFVDQKINYNPKEIESFHWMSLNDLEKDLSENSEKYTVWLSNVIQVVKTGEHFL